MTALVIGLALGAALIPGGVGWARHFDSEEPPIPLGVAALLAGFVVMAGDGAAWLGYSLPLALVSIGVLSISSWIWREKTDWQALAKRIIQRPRVTSLLALTALALAEPLLVLPVPLDTDAQGFGYLSLMIRQGGTIDSLAPWHPGVASLYSPGALIVFATLSSIFANASMSAVMMGATHAVTFLFAWLAWEFGHELGQRANIGSVAPSAGPWAGPETWAGAMAFSAATSIGLWTALMDSHYTAIFALLFELAFLTSLFRFLRSGSLMDMALGVLTLAAVPITHPDSTIILMLGLGAFSVLAWSATDRPSIKRWLQVSVGIPFVAAILILPWLVRIWPLVSSGIESPFQTWLAPWQVSILYHGLIWPALSLLGVWIYLRSRQSWALMMAGWWIAAFELGTLGNLAQTFPGLMKTLLRFIYPFSIAWHAPIVPYMALGAGALVWIMNKTNLPRFATVVWPAMGVVAMLLVLSLLFANKLLSLSKGRIEFYGAFATSDDLQAMRWLHDHTPPEARVLNYPGDYEHQRDWEAHWAPVITERDCIYFRMQPFFRDSIRGGSGNLREVFQEQQAMLSFWYNPADIANAGRLHEAHITYVLVPESVGEPESMAQSWRWQPPALLPDIRSMPRDASYLRLAFQMGGAQVYEVEP